jgi:hypothetical protein
MDRWLEGRALGVGRRGKMLPAAIAALALIALATAATAAAAPNGGQVGATWGTPGIGSGQFFNPALFGVDPSDGTVYGGDQPSSSNFRVQQFSGTGEFKASVLIPKFSDAESKIPVTLQGIAVDHSLERFYLIEGCRISAATPGTCKGQTATKFAAQRILVFSTKAEAGKLVKVTTLPLPTTVGEALFKPSSIAVDPSNHDLAIMAENSEGHTIVQRVSSGGVIGARFTDSADTLRPGTGPANSLAVSNAGVTYTLTGKTAPGSELTRAWQLPANLSKVEEVPGFAAAAKAENWAAGLQSSALNLAGSPQIAISPDGTELYWKELIKLSGPAEAGNFLVRGFSLTGSKSSHLYGGGASKCQVLTASAGIGTTSDKLVVFDYGPELSKTSETPPYGLKVVTFGPTGEGCPEPLAKFSVNGKEGEEVSVKKGDTVSFDAKNSQLYEGFRKELIWKFGDGSEQTVKSTKNGKEEDVPAVTTVSHKYTTSGKFTVKLEIKLEQANFGDPTPAEQSLTVQGEVPLFKLTVSKTGSGSGTITSSPAGIDCGGDCSEEYEEGKIVALSAAAEPGSEFKGWSGACSSAGSCEVTMSAAKAVSAEFALSGGGGGPYCTGNDIAGVGSTLQRVAQQEVWGPAFPIGVCPAGANIAYEPVGSAKGMQEWNYDGKKGSINAALSFVGTDEAPTAAQIANIKSVAGGARVVVVPVAQTAIAVVANPPAGCEIGAIANAQLASVLEGKTATWSQLETAEGTCGSPITRVVHKDGLGTTFQLKNYLFQLNKKALFCASGQTWQGLANTSWPESCGEKSLTSVLRPATDGGVAEVEKVNATSGSIGYAALPDAEAGNASLVLEVQNNGQKKAIEAEYADPISGAVANCGGMQYKTPIGGGSLDMDWFQVFGAQPNIGGSDYPLCMLTYDLAFHGYEAAGFSVGDERTVKDYLKSYIVQAGQSAIAGNGYSALPSSPNARYDVLGAARKAAAKIIR